MQGTDDNSQNRPRGMLRSFGCLLPMAEIGGALIVLGGIGLSRWSGLSAASQIASVFAIVIGSLLVLPLIGVVVLRIFLERVKTRMAEAVKNAGSTLGERVVNLNKDIFQEVHEYRPATESDFAGADQAFYERSTAELTERGCRQMGDVVNATLEKVKGVHPAIRMMLTADGSSVVSFNHLVIDTNSRLVRGRELKMSSVETEFDDGTFLAVSNLGDVGLLTPPPEVQKVACPLEATPLEVFARHADELSKLTHKKPIVMTTLAETLAMQQRLNAAVTAFRQDIGYVDPEEVRRIALASGRGDDVADNAARSVDEARHRDTE